LVTFQLCTDKAAAVVVRSVALEAKDTSLKLPTLVVGVGGAPSDQEAAVFRLGLDPLKTLSGTITVRERLNRGPVPTELDAVRTAVVGPPKVVAVPLMRPFVVFKERPAGRVPEVSA
jgi:hypothetical protein